MSHLQSLTLATPHTHYYSAYSPPRAEHTLVCVQHCSRADKVGGSSRSNLGARLDCRLYSHFLNLFVSPRHLLDIKRANDSTYRARHNVTPFLRAAVPLLSSLLFYLAQLAVAGYLGVRRCRLLSLEASFFISRLKYILPPPSLPPSWLSKLLSFRNKGFFSSNSKLFSKNRDFTFPEFNWFF